MQEVFYYQQIVHAANIRPPICDKSHILGSHILLIFIKITVPGFCRQFSASETRTGSPVLVLNRNYMHTIFSNK